MKSQPAGAPPAYLFNPMLIKVEAARAGRAWLLRLALLSVLFVSGCAVQQPAPRPALPVTPSLAAATQVQASATPAEVEPLTAGTLPPTEAGPTSTPKPAGPAYTWKQIASGLTRPADLVNPPDKSGDLLILEQTGKILVFANGMILANPLLDISAKVGSNGNEQGLLGIALHPKYNENGYFYVNYTDLNGNTVIARFQSGMGQQQVDPESEKVLLRVKQPYPNHNGGSMAFGADGFLYIGLGDGGSSGDPKGNGQALNTLLGKLLRIDVNQGERYAIPPDNPFASGGGLPEIWAYGLRNPWRLAFDRQTNDLYIGDVGQNVYEEIDYLPGGSPGGANFGWKYREGLHAFSDTQPGGLKLVDPIFEYAHNQGCSVIGGFVYRGRAIPALNGVYIYGDYCNGRVWGLQRDPNGVWQNQLLSETRTNISSFGQDQAGELYLLDTREGRVFKLVPLN